MNYSSSLPTALKRIIAGGKNARMAADNNHAKQASQMVKRQLSKRSWNCRIVALTADQTGHGLPEERQQLAQLGQGAGVSGVALQHRAARRHVERRRVHRVHRSGLAR